MTRTAACSLLLARAACRAPTLGVAPPAEAPERTPFAAVVWELEDKTEDFTTRPSSLDGAPETSLTRSGSAWRPALSMEVLSGVLAGELSARLTQSCGSSRRWGGGGGVGEGDEEGGVALLLAQLDQPGEGSAGK